jgi:hypothetical protein
VADWTVGERCRVVEHDDATRQPRKRGRVIPAVVVQAGAVYVQARADDGSLETYYRESGWRSGDGRHQWRLMPLTDEAAAAAVGEGSHG